MFVLKTKLLQPFQASYAKAHWHCFEGMWHSTACEMSLFSETVLVGMLFCKNPKTQCHNLPFFEVQRWAVCAIYGLKNVPPTCFAGVHFMTQECLSLRLNKTGLSMRLAEAVASGCTLAGGTWVQDILQSVISHKSLPKAANRSHIAPLIAYYVRMFTFFWCSIY